MMIKHHILSVELAFNPLGGVKVGGGGHCSQCNADLRAVSLTQCEH